VVNINGGRWASALPGPCPEELGDKDGAIGEHADALQLRQALAAEHLAASGYRSDLARTYGNLGSLYTTTGRPEKAEASCTEAMRLLQGLADERPAVPSRADLALQGERTSIHCLTRGWGLGGGSPSCETGP
jgi:hypothetical protein